jgi:hypothetical protein
MHLLHRALLTGSIALGGLLVSCSSSHPSEEVMRDAITAYLKTDPGRVCSGGFVRCESDSLRAGYDPLVIEAIEIKQIGTKQNTYWPVRAAVRGSGTLVQLRNDDGTRRGNKTTVQFDKVLDFHIYQDDYGAWQAKVAGR